MPSSPALNSPRLQQTARLQWLLTARSPPRKFRSLSYLETLKQRLRMYASAFPDQQAHFLPELRTEKPRAGEKQQLKTQEKGLGPSPFLCFVF